MNGSEQSPAVTKLHQFSPARWAVQSTWGAAHLLYNQSNMVVAAGRARHSSRPHAAAAAAAAAAGGSSGGLTSEAEEVLLQASSIVDLRDTCADADSLPLKCRLRAGCPTLLPHFPQLFAVQDELPIAQAAAVAARTGCTAEAALHFFRGLRAAWDRCLLQARERAAAGAAEAAAAAAAAEGRTVANAKAAAAAGPQADRGVQALLAAGSAARQAAAAKLRALQDGAGQGLRDASVTGKHKGRACGVQAFFFCGMH